MSAKVVGFTCQLLIKPLKQYDLRGICLRTVNNIIY